MTGNLGALNTWNHYIIKVDRSAGTINTYKNLVLDVTGTTGQTGNYDSGILSICGRFTGALFFTGILAYLTVWNRITTTAEDTAHKER